MKATSASPDPWTERYETLRQFVLSDRQNLGADPFGLVLLLRNGIAVWMGSWREASSWSGPSVSCGPVPTVSPSSPVWQQQLTQLLAQMTSAHLGASCAL